MLVDYMK